MDRMTSHLDIRSFLKMYVDLRLLIKRLMTGPQRKLFAYQKDRLPMLEDEDSFDSDLDVEEKVHQPESLQEFSSMLGKYEIKTELDRRLLLGVLERDFHLSKF